MVKKIFIYFALIPFCLSLFLYLTPAQKAFAAVKQLDNPGFENGYMQGWSHVMGTGAVSETDQRSFNGRTSLKIVDESSTTSDGVASTKIPIAAGQIYNAKAMAYLESGNGAMIFLRYYDSTDVLLNQFTATITSPMGSWATVNVSGAAPANAVKADVLLYTSVAQVSTVYFDDVSIEYNVANPNFETGDLTGWTQQYGNGGVFATNLKSYSGSYSVKIEDTSLTEAKGIRSVTKDIVEGETYRAKAMLYIDSGNGAMIFLRYYNSSDVLLGQFNTTKASPVGQWGEINVSGTAPTGATKADVLLYTGSGQVSQVYFDDVSIDNSFVNLGPQITNSLTLEGVFTKNTLNKDVLYTVSAGQIAKFVEVDIATNTSNRVIDLPFGSGAWSMVEATDGKIYIGAYDTGHLYQYVKGQSTVTDLGRVFTELYIWGLTAGPNGKIFGGTYPGAKIFQYDPVNGITDLGNGPIYPGEKYVRSITYDSANNIIYAGVGSHAHLVKFDLNTQTKTDILPALYQNYSFVYSLDIRNGKLFASLKVPDDSMIVMDLQTGNVDSVINGVFSTGVSPISPKNANIVYFTGVDGHIKAYDIALKAVTSFDINAGILNVKEFGFIKNSTEDVLVVLGTFAEYANYNLDTSSLSVSKFDVEETPSTLHGILQGPGGKMYTSGLVSGGTGILDPSTGHTVQYKGLGQAEGMASLGNNMYFSVYPRAIIYKYDTTQAWSMGDPNNNPVEIFRLESYDQDRAYGMLGVASENKLFIGTSASYGHLEGAFAIYNTTTGGLQVEKNLVSNQSIVSLAYKNGEVIGGTSVIGGSGTTSTEPSAKLFVWNVNAGAKTYETVPVTNAKTISGLTLASDGKIWGMADGNLFVFNPATRTIDYSSQIYVMPTSYFNDTHMVDGNDGYVYLTSIRGKQLIKINISTKAVTVLKSISADGLVDLAMDSAGYLYFNFGEELWRYQR